MTLSPRFHCYVEDLFYVNLSCKVYPRWIKINIHFQEMAQQENSPWAYEVKACLNRNNSGWTARMVKQLLSIHVVAYFLKPVHRGNWYTLGGVCKPLQQQVTDFLDDYG